MSETIRSLRELDDRQIGAYSFEYIERRENSPLIVVNEVNEPIDLITVKNANRKFRTYNIDIEYKAPLPLKKITSIKSLNTILNLYGKNYLGDSSNWEIKRNIEGKWIYKHFSVKPGVWVDVDIVLRSFGYYINQEGGF